MVSPMPYVHRQCGIQHENAAIWMNDLALPLFFRQRFKQLNPTTMEAIQQVEGWLNGCRPRVV